MMDMQSLFNPAADNTSGVDISTIVKIGTADFTVSVSQTQFK
jgi:hypothetical protein